MHTFLWIFQSDVWCSVERKHEEERDDGVSAGGRRPRARRETHPWSSSRSTGSEYTA